MSWLRFPHVQCGKASQTASGFDVIHKRGKQNSPQSFAPSGYSVEKTQALPRVHVAWHPTADLGNRVIDNRYFYPNSPDCSFVSIFTAFIHMELDLC